jgi:hypothetical protein
VYELTADCEASRRYVAAHDVHHRTKDLRKALRLYVEVLNDHPEAVVAEAAHSQIANILNRVVPKQTLLDEKFELAIVHLEC